MSEDSDDSQKTEDPTSKRLDEARNEGRVPKSQEFNHLLMILALTLAVLMFGQFAGKQIASVALPFLEAPDQIPTDLGHLLNIAWRTLGLILLAGAAPLVLAFLAAFGASYLQFGLLWSAENLMPSLDKISPMAGFKRIFSLHSVTELIKGIMKIAIVAAVVGAFIMPSVGDLHRLIGMDMVQLMAIINDKMHILLIGVFAVMGVIAGADIFYQRYEYLKGLRMSRQDLRDEYKQTEGDPLVKGRLRQLRMERARRRMMGEVPKADVVVTNPTHYAVALKYDQTAMSAPKVVAKGTDKVALRIREVAEGADVPVIENPPLARGLYAAVEIDQEIPSEYYKAVAELISYIFKLKKRRL
ncbi:flagellar biosynthesis protein FlhB [Dongia rigui]|uniref:Flagellar biosynthetic protein FlhB n=1 Tax=Dongia rigui TaxID=940149 RepID=A0ABU5DUA0_9PROT|nr:flagellar biosynthesis protein FlhB [Dongia rigui]MDY0870514.1 flagellar biosynthesis protein FlhB [Dongia rigui]